MRLPELLTILADWRGHLNERGKRYAPTAISRMLAS
jgi:hypothetical protein